MKRLIATIATSAVLVGSLVGSAAADTWTGTISQLPATMNTHNFNVEYNAFSLQANSFTAQLKVLAPGSEGYLPCGSTQDTSADPNDVNGGAGSINVAACVPSDGDYSFEVVITRDGTGGSDVQTVGPTSTHVDATAPGAPIYHGKTQAGNSYTLSFNAPSDSDVASVQIFASTSKTYTANATTRVGSVTVSPNGAYSFSYTAPDSATRYFSLQAFDTAGNGSAIVGDPGTVITPVRFINQLGGSGSGGTASTAAATTGQVAGASTTNGQVNATGQSKTNQGNNGKVLGSETVVNHSNTAWYVVGGLVILFAAAYYWFFIRTGKGWFGKSQP